MSGFTGRRVRNFRGQRVVISSRLKPRVKRRMPMGRAMKADPFTARVKRILNANSETKYVAQQIVNDTAVPYVGGAATTFLPMLPVVGQGSGQSNQREGERIQPVKVRADFQFCYDPTSTVSHDYRVKLFVLRPKQFNNYPAMTASGFTGQFLDNGDQTSADWDPLNQLISDQKPVDSEYWNIVQIKKFKLIKNSTTVDGAIPPGQPNTSRSSIVNYSVPLYGRALKKKLVYSGAGPNLPNNYNPVFCLIAYAADGSAPQIISPIKATVRLHMWFKDE